jgi:hypothetical protein
MMMERFLASFPNVFVLLSLGILLLLKCFCWVLRSVGGAVKVGDPYIYICIGSTFKEAANGDVATFLSVVGCGYLIGLCWGIGCGGCRVVVNELSRREDGGSWSAGKDWLDITVSA